MREPMTTVEWLYERRDNCTRIANLKFGVDREGWEEDEAFFQAAIDEIVDGHAKIVELESERAALRADAERYRWLRMNRLWLKANLPMMAAPEFDDAIDAARIAP